MSLIAATEAVANGEKTTAYITSNGLSNKIASGEKKTCHDKISERKTGKNDGADAVRDEGRT